MSALTLRKAETMIRDGVDAAITLKVAMNLAVVDTGGHLVAFVRMDGAWLGSVDIAVRKARTAMFFNMPSANLGELSQPGGPLYGIEHTNGGLVTFGGGQPVLDAVTSRPVGAVGVSGGTVEQDVAVARAMLGVSRG